MKFKKEYALSGLATEGFEYNLMSGLWDIGSLGQEEPAYRFIRHWRNMQHTSGCLIPPKTLLSPNSIKSILPYVYISEWTDSADLTIRLCGTGLASKFGMDMTGRNVFDFIDTEEVAAQRRFYGAMLDQPCGGAQERLFRNGRKVPFLFVSLHLPLTDGDGKIRYFAGIGRAAPAPVMSVLASQHHQTDTSMTLRQTCLDIGAGLPALASEEDWQTDILPYGTPGPDLQPHG